MPIIQVDGEAVEITEQQLEQMNGSFMDKADEVRMKRDELLAVTDLWGLADYPATQAQLDYRQALRDIPSQEGFPDSVTWPTKPE